MVGRLGILEARKYATSALGKKFSLKDFHYQVMQFVFYYFASAQILELNSLHFDLVALA